MTWVGVYIICIIFIPFPIREGMIFTIIYWILFYILSTEGKPKKKVITLSDEEKKLLKSISGNVHDNIVIMLDYYKEEEVISWCMDVYNWSDIDAIEIVSAIKNEKETDENTKNAL